MRRAGFAPRAEHYNVLLNGLVRLRDHERAHAVLVDMVRAGVRPTLYTYNALLDAAVRSGNVTRAYEIIDALEDSGASLASGAEAVRVARDDRFGPCACARIPHR